MKRMLLVLLLVFAVVTMIAAPTDSLAKGWGGGYGWYGGCGWGGYWGGYGWGYYPAYYGWYGGCGPYYGGWWW
jgi:hypothetical protein